MKNQNNHPSNFWFGFALGTASAAAAAYLLGTTKGRETLKKLVEMSEHIETKSPDFMAAFHEVVQHITSSTAPPTQTPESEPTVTNATNIDSVMDRIKSATQPGKYVKKFFEKTNE
jgi:hypothetical protein